MATDQTSSLRLGDDLSSNASPGLPKMKFGALSGKNVSAKTNATKTDSATSDMMKNPILSKLNSNLT